MAETDECLGRAHSGHDRRWERLVKDCDRRLGRALFVLVFYLHVLPDPPNFILRKSDTGIIIVAPFLAAACVTVTVQALATSLIAYKAWSVSLD